MSDTFVTLHGWVGSEVTFREPNGISVVNLRVASTPRLKRDGKWVDGETTWYSVTAWRALADNIRSSVRKGDAVIVHGRLRTEVWRREDGQLNSTLQIEATLIGHDLTRGSSTFLRTQRPERQDTDVDSEVEEMIRSVPADLGPVDSWGNPRGDGTPAPEPPAAPEASDAA